MFGGTCIINMNDIIVKNLKNNFLSKFFSYLMIFQISTASSVHTSLHFEKSSNIEKQLWGKWHL